jgi:hypothetical protein
MAKWHEANGVIEIITAWHEKRSGARANAKAAGMAAYRQWQ